MSFIEQLFFGSQVITFNVWLVRGIIAFLFLLMMVRLMGQAEVGNLSVIDFVFAIAIGNIIGTPLVDPTASLTLALISVALWTISHLALNYLGLKLPRIGRLFKGEPVVLVQQGQVLEESLNKSRMNLDDLLSQLRLHGAPRLNDVEFAILEPNGKVSVSKKAEAQPVTPADLQIHVPYQGLPSILVLDGRVEYANLEKMGLSVTWLEQTLEQSGVDRIEDVSIAQVDASGTLYIDLYDDQKSQPVNTQKAQTLATLKKLAAQMETFAHETDDDDAKEQYIDHAQSLHEQAKALTPFLTLPSKWSDHQPLPGYEYQEQEGGEDLES